MKHKLKKKFICSIFVLLIYNSLTIYGEDGEKLFKNNCAACHNIDGIPLVGPNLKDITKKREKEWLKKFILNSKQLYDNGDVIAKKIIDEYKGMVMPSFNFNDQMLESILTYIEGEKKTTESDITKIDTSDTYKKIDNETEQALVEKGYKLFIGNIPFKNNGISCVACHNIRSEKFNKGGYLARDLTKVYTRMNKNEIALKNIISSMPYPAMAKAYEKSPLTDEEINTLTIFLKHEDSKNFSSSFSWELLYMTIVISIIIVLLIRILYRQGRIKSMQILLKQNKK